MSSEQETDRFFTPFRESIAEDALPQKFTNPFDYEPHSLALMAVEELQKHLRTQTEWEHNFGLEAGQEGAVIGKMFGVLVVKTAEGALGYLSAFSGKLAGGNHHSRFVPPVYDMLTEGSFLNKGMAVLKEYNAEVKRLEAAESGNHELRLTALKGKRRALSGSLQARLFDEYKFRNQAGMEKNLRTLFMEHFGTKPRAGAGECAAPKLLQYAFEHNMRPIAMAEFWWGLSPKSEHWKHKQYYPACQEKCAAILGFMLEGIEMEDNAV